MLASTSVDNEKKVCLETSVFYISKYQNSCLYIFFKMVIKVIALYCPVDLQRFTIFLSL